MDFVYDNDDNPISPDSVMIGVCHSYDGFQRLVKYNQRTQGHAAAQSVAGDAKALMHTNYVISSKERRHFASDTGVSTVMHMELGDSHAPETPSKPKVNPFSTHSLLSSQKRNANKMSAQLAGSGYAQDDATDTSMRRTKRKAPKAKSKTKTKGSA